MSAFATLAPQAHTALAGGAAQRDLITRVLLPAMVSGVASFTLSLLLGPYVIKWLRGIGAGTEIRAEGLQAHLSKRGTPLMGGALFSGVTSVLTVVYNLVNHWSQLLTVGALVSCSVLGAVDDRLTTVRVGSAGMRARFKLAWTVVIAIVIVFALHAHGLLAHPNRVWVPAAHGGWVDLSPWIFWPLAVFAIVATAHSVNLADGLDGLAAGSGAVAFAFFGAIALLTTGYKYTGEFCFTMVGALLAFLWFNIYPARIFMGDTGSLAIGACLATVALSLNQVLILPVIGFVYVIITVSTMLQVGYFKLTGGRRLLRQSPLHNHLQLVGWHENQITQRFWIVSMLCGVAGLALAFG